ncbi:hypothetical protein [Haloarcula rubripromontorii]|uniref:hypothetical protein n=1 Tax=Haloarcula rubripromontorii TaxID=1705562 RepID=UPI00345C07BA
MTLVTHLMGLFGVFSAGVSIFLLYLSWHMTEEYKQLYLNFSAASATSGVYLIDSYFFDAIGYDGFIIEYEIFPLAGVLVGFLFIIFKLNLYKGA